MNIMNILSRLQFGVKTRSSKVQFIKIYNKNNKKYSQNYLVSQQQHNEIITKKKVRQPDRFGILKINSVKKLISLYRNPVNNLTMNEKISILYRASELIEEEMRDFDKTHGLQDVLNQIQKKIRTQETGSDEDPMMGRLAYVLKSFNYYWDLKSEDQNGQQQSIWIYINDYICQDIFDSGHDEVFLALQGLSNLRSHLQQDWQKDLHLQSLSKLEIMLTQNIQTHKYPLNQLQLIAQLIVHNQSDNLDLMQEIQFQVLNIINKQSHSSIEFNENQYEIDDLINFGFYMSQAGFIACDLFEYLNMEMLRQMEEGRQSLGQRQREIKIKGESLWKLVFFWNYILENDQGKIVNRDLMDWVYIWSMEIDYQKVEEFIVMSRLINWLQLDNQKEREYRELMQHKMIQLQGQDLIGRANEITEYLSINNFVLPDPVFLFLDQQFVLNLHRFHISEVLLFLQTIHSHSLIPKFHLFINSLSSYVLLHAYQYQLDDLSYFYIILNDHQNLINDQLTFLSHLNAIKDQIKFTSMSRGFKIEVNSNFHKLLNQIDLAEFFEGGEQQM